MSTANYTKLVGTGTQGDFVKTSQGVASEHGFNHVSRYWYPQTKSYDEGFEELERGRQSREDILSPVQGFAPIVNSDGDLVFAYEDGREFKLDEWAATQFFTRIEVPVTVWNWLDNPKLKPNGEVKYNRDDKDAALLRANILNGYRRTDPKKKFRFRTYNGDTIRAVMTEDYTPVDNRWYLETVKTCIPGGRLSHWRGDADTIFGNVLIPDTIREEKDSDYGGMISLSNCEIGKRRLSQYPSVFRAICMNGCIWSQTKGKNLNKVHRGKAMLDLITLRKTISENIQYQIPLTTAGIKRILETQVYPITKVKNFIAEIVHSYGLKPVHAAKIAESFVKEESTHRNLFGVIQSITRAGQTFDNQTWVKMDEIAGELSMVNAAGFDRIRNRAENLSDEFIAEVFAI